MFKGSSPKPPETEGVSAMTGVPEKVVLDWVGVMLDEAVVVSYFLRLRLAKAKKMSKTKAKRAITPTVMLEIVAMPMDARDFLTDLA